MRPSKFIQPDEDIWKANTAKFTQKTGVEVKIDWESWEDIRPKMAVAASIGSGPDIVMGWYDDPHQYPDKVVLLDDIAKYLGERNGGWYPTPTKYCIRDGRWLAVPVGVGGGAMTYRTSWLKKAGLEKFPTDFPGMLAMARKVKEAGKAGGLALGNAVGDGNTWHWILWGFGGAVVDEKNRVILDSPETVAALEYARELYQTFVPGTLSWLDPSNNKAYLADEISWTHNGISIYFAAKNSKDPKVQAIAADTDHAIPPIGPSGKPTATAAADPPRTPRPSSHESAFARRFERRAAAPAGARARPTGRARRTARPLKPRRPGSRFVPARGSRRGCRACLRRCSRPPGSRRDE